MTSGSVAPPWHRRWAQGAWPFIVLLLCGLAVAWPALTWPMAFDDLHLMRRFTPAQILASFHSQWDPERLMTRGLRPLTLVFNHARMTMFGEDVVGHRVLVIVLHALYCALLVPVARRFEVGRATVVAAGLLWLASPPSVFHYVWITDGNHALQGLAFAAAALGLLRGLERGRTGPLVLSLAAILAGVLVREDTLAALPALLILGHARAGQIPGARRRSYGYVGAVVLLCAGLFAYRSRVVAKVQPPGTDVLGLLEHARKMANPVGESGFDRLSWLLIDGWWVLLAGLAVALLIAAGRHRHLSATIWLPCAFFACTPGLNVRRDDLLFFAGTFFALFVASAVATIGRARPLWGRLAAVVLAWGTLGGAYVGRVFAENFHPDSLRVVWWNGRYVYGAYSQRANIPPARRKAVVRRLAEVGIYNVHHHVQGTRKMERQALALGRRRPAPDGSLFYPLLPWSED